MSFFPPSSRRAFVLTKRDGHRANKNEIATFIFGVTTKHFPHDLLLHFIMHIRPSVSAFSLARVLAPTARQARHSELPYRPSGHPLAPVRAMPPRGCQRTTVPPRLFPGAPRGIRWRPNVPPHGQRDRDSISDCRSRLNGRWCLSPGWANAGSQRPTMRDRLPGLGRRHLQPQAILHPAPEGEAALPRFC